MPKRTIRNKCNKFFLFNQTLKDIEHVNGDILGYDMSYDEIKELFRKSPVEVFNYHCNERFKKKNQGRYCICNESKNTYIECTPGTKPFLKTHDSYSHKYF